MSGCSRFEEEGLLLLERGVALPEHFSGCPDCRAARAEYERLKEAIASTTDHARPDPDWRRRTWEEIDRRARRRRWRWLLAPMAAAAALLLVFFVDRLPSGEETVTFRQRLEAGGQQRRGGEARPGDRLVMTAATGGAAYSDIRVYRGENELVFSCSAAACVRGQDRVEASLALETIGRYQPVLLLSDQPIPPPRAGLDSDTAAALGSGARAELGEAVEVR